MWKGTKTMKNRCYLDVHVLQTVPPSCVNRDDTGSPKTAIYGGTTRARVSSQAWKHAMREMFREDEPMPLTSGEFAVLKALVSHPREPLSRDKLMNLARGREYSAMERSIDVQISRLRRMVEEDPAHPRYIQTVWGLGYVFVPDGSKA